MARVVCLSVRPQREALCVVGYRRSGCALAGNFSGQRGYHSPSNSSTQVFDVNFLKVDSDKAFEGVAQKHGGDKVLQKSPDTPILYVLDWNHAGNMLVWHVIYGNSRDDAKLIVDVDGTTGEFIRTEK